MRFKDRLACLPLPKAELLKVSLQLVPGATMGEKLATKEQGEVSLWQNTVSKT